MWSRKIKIHWTSVFTQKECHAKLANWYWNPKLFNLIKIWHWQTFWNLYMSEDSAYLRKYYQKSVAAVILNESDPKVICWYEQVLVGMFWLVFI